MYNVFVSSSVSVSIFHSAWLDFFWADLTHMCVCARAHWNNYWLFIHLKNQIKFTFTCTDIKKINFSCLTQISICESKEIRF